MGSRPPLLIRWIEVLHHQIQIRQSGKGIAVKPMQ